MSSYSIPGYDAWKLAAPDENEMTQDEIDAEDEHNARVATQCDCIIDDEGEERFSCQPNSCDCVINECPCTTTPNEFCLCGKGEGA
jgi:hypothetical protein